MNNRSNIRMLGMNTQSHGISIAPMLSDYLQHEQGHTIEIPHRHEFYSFFLLERGLLGFTVDFQSILLKPYSLLLINPGQIHHCTSYTDISGWVMSFDSKMVDQKSRNKMAQYLRQIAILEIDITLFDKLSRLLTLLHQGSKSQISGGFGPQYLQSLLNAVFYSVVDLFLASENEAHETYSPRALTITKHFQNLVREHYKTWKKPAQYASSMHISVSYLNDTLKAATGLSSTHFIQQEIIHEAQNLLVYTNQTVKEIAGNLGYDDHKYFTRVFRKVTKTSPSKFRHANSIPGIN